MHGSTDAAIFKMQNGYDGASYKLLSFQDCKEPFRRIALHYWSFSTKILWKVFSYAIREKFLPSKYFNKLNSSLVIMEHPVERMQIYKTIVDAAELIAMKNFNY